LSILYNQEPNLPKPLRNVHQLDHSTSGCYCLALTKEAAGLASVSFAQRRVEKSYLAIVREWMEKDVYTVETPIAEVPNNRYRMCIGSEDNPGKEAKTEIKVIRRGYFYPIPLQSNPLQIICPSPNHNNPIKVTLISLHPVTGRRHQLRLHCQYLGHPIVGDWHYEKQSMDYTDTFRMMLHAKKLVIPLENIKKENRKKIDYVTQEGGIDNKNKSIKILQVESNDPFSELVFENVKKTNS